MTDEPREPDDAGDEGLHAGPDLIELHELQQWADAVKEAEDD